MRDRTANGSVLVAVVCTKLVDAATTAGMSGGGSSLDKVVIASSAKVVADENSKQKNNKKRHIARHTISFLYVLHSGRHPSWLDWRDKS